MPNQNWKPKKKFSTGLWTGCKTVTLLFPWLSIWIDSKSIVWDSSVVFNVYLDWLDLCLTSLLFQIRPQMFWFSIFTWLTHCTFKTAYVKIELMLLNIRVNIPDLTPFLLTFTYSLYFYQNPYIFWAKPNLYYQIIWHNPWNWSNLSCFSVASWKEGWHWNGICWHGRYTQHDQEKWNQVKQNFDLAL